ncbi:hypothetical protein, partial [Mesorhizobium sp.]|uniref:hypothetical protein n=1 Tax=Mesorhizobium sp. TaxID=1871066 RepID=UPI00338D6465
GRPPLLFPALQLLSSFVSGFRPSSTRGKCRWQTGSEAQRCSHDALAKALHEAGDFSGRR